MISELPGLEHSPVGKLQTCDRLLCGVGVCCVVQVYPSFLGQSDGCVWRLAIPVCELRLRSHAAGSSSSSSHGSSCCPQQQQQRRCWIRGGLQRTPKTLIDALLWQQHVLH